MPLNFSQPINNQTNNKPMNTPVNELKLRWRRCQTLLDQIQPEASGLLVFSRLNIFYYSGSLINGVLWIPKESEPTLFCKKGIERAKLESPLTNIVEFRSYRDLKSLLHDSGNSLDCCAAEMNGLPWSLANSLQKYMTYTSFVSGDLILAITRSKKSERELEILRQIGEKHHRSLTRRLPAHLRRGMSELEIAHKISDIYFSEGHQGMLRMETFGEEIYQGHIAIGESANYPSVFNGPVGLQGVHPATPFMGSEDIVWKKNQPLTIDNGFSIKGYQTDKTQVYWLGDESTIPTDVQAAHNFCLEVQQMISENLKPGAIPSRIYKDALKMVEKTPWKAGFMGLGKNKVCFVGHGIGLAVDEYPVLADKFDQPLEAGNVLAVEPKIGIEGLGMVGTENTFEVTETGGISITGDDYQIICIDK